MHEGCRKNWTFTALLQDICEDCQYLIDAASSFFFWVLTKMQHFLLAKCIGFGSRSLGYTMWKSVVLVGLMNGEIASFWREGIRNMSIIGKGQVFIFFMGLYN